MELCLMTLVWEVCQVTGYSDDNLLSFFVLSCVTKSTSYSCQLPCTSVSTIPVLISTREYPSPPLPLLPLPLLPLPLLPPPPLKPLNSWLPVCALCMLLGCVFGWWVVLEIKSSVFFSAAKLHTNRIQTQEGWYLLIQHFSYHWMSIMHAWVIFVHVYI